MFPGTEIISKTLNCECYQAISPRSIHLGENLVGSTKAQPKLPQSAWKIEEANTVLSWRPRQVRTAAGVMASSTLPR
jgi:hypothetical protein